MSKPSGVPVVLTADRTLMAKYDVLLDGMMAASQTTSTPWFIMDHLLMPRAGHWEGGSRCAPLGLRRIEAALLQGGFSVDEVMTVDDAHLEQTIGPDTKLVAISTGEPAGRGMSSSTMVAVAGGRIYPLELFRSLLAQVRKLIDARAPEAKVVVGGPGAWQLAADPALCAELGVDHVVTGYAEANVAGLFREMLNGGDAPKVSLGIGADAETIPRIVGPTTMGVVEISRGCGLGCRFCTIAHSPMMHLPVDTILSDIKTNLASGASSISILSEDFFRYGGTATSCEPGATIGLLEQIRRVDGVRLIQCDHANVSSIAQYSDDELARVRELLVRGTGSKRPWVNVGVETPSGGLLKAIGCGAKMGAIGAEDWGNVCAEQLVRLSKAGFIPMASLLVGSPGETPAHSALALEWVRALGKESVTVFPVIYAPINGHSPPAALTTFQWQLISECYELNFKWVPKLYWDSQKGAGTPLSRRLLFQALGKGQTVLWRKYLGTHLRRSLA